MENFSEITRRQLSKSSEIEISKKVTTGVYKKSITKKLHQPFINTHTLKNLREGQIPRYITGNSHFSVENFLWRYNNKEKGRWIR